MTSICYVAPIEWSVLNNADYLNKLPDEEQQQATRYLHPQRLQSFIASRLLLRRCLSLHENRELEWHFLRHNQRLILDNTQTALHTSLSHSANWVACILSLSPHCGIDIEQKIDNPQFMAIAKRFFAPQEYDFLNTLPQQQALPVFLDFWTRKEACVKAWHQGLAHHLASVIFTMNTNNPINAPSAYQHLPLVVHRYDHSDWHVACAIHTSTPTPPPLIVFDGVCC